MITHIFNSSVVSGPETLALPALRKLGLPVSIIFLTENRLREASLGPVEYARSLGHEVYTIAVAGRYDKTAFLALRTLLDDLKPMLVHAHDVKASLYLLRAKTIRTGFKPYVVSTHHGASYRKGKIRLYEEFYVRRVLPHYDLVLSVCQEDVKSIARRGVPADRILLHLNGTNRRPVDESLRDSIQAKIRESWKDAHPELPSAHEAIFLGAVARLSPEKRHDRMIKVLKHLREFYPNTHIKPILVFFGIGHEEQKLKKLVEKLELSESVYFMGFSQTISEEIAGFDLLLSLSDGEGIPINLIEAGWAGTPVVATKVGGIPDLISSEKVGILVDKKEKDENIARIIFEMLSKPTLLKNIGQAFQSRVSNDFSESAWLHKLRKHYQTLNSSL